MWLVAKFVLRWARGLGFFLGCAILRLGEALFGSGDDPDKSTVTGGEWAATTGGSTLRAVSVSPTERPNDGHGPPLGVTNDAEAPWFEPHSIFEPAKGVFDGEHFRRES